MYKQNLIVLMISAILIVSAVNCSCPGTGPAKQPPAPSAPAVAQPATPAAPAVAQTSTPAAPAASPPTEPAGPASRSKLAVPLTPEAATTGMALGSSKEELTTQWQTLVKEAAEGKVNPDGAIAIARALVSFGPDAINPLFDTLAEPSGSPYPKIVATMGIKSVISPAVLDRILLIVKPENEAVSRACAVGLLGDIMDPRAETALNEYKKDPDRGVRFEAIFGLAKRSPEGCKALLDLWKSPDLTAPEHNDIVARIASMPILASPEAVLEILHGAIQNPAIEENLRLASVTALGQMGKSESLAPLAACAEKDPSQAVKDAAKSASEAIAAKANAPKPNSGS